jgi:hypothetical protein
MAIAQNFGNTKPSLLLDFANTKQLDSRITYTRASTASFYNGVTTAKAEENFLTYSQEFDNAVWTKNQTTITANSTAAPDGTTTADTVTGSAGTALKYITHPVTSTLNSALATFSIFAKEGTHRFIQVSINSDASKYVNFDLNGSGATSAFGSGVTSSVVAVANGFIRCIVTLTGAAGTSRFFVSLQDSLSAAREASTASTGDIFLWGAQAEIRSAVTAYTATTTQAITNYIPVLQTAASGVARFDNNPTTGESLGLLIEESRTNLVTYSSEFDNAAWGKASVTVTADTIVSPDGTITGDLMKSNSNGNDFVGQSPTLATTTVATYSFYIKNVDATISRMMARNSVTSMEIYINWSGSTLSSLTLDKGTSTSFVAVGNGWYRVQATFTTGETNQQFRIYPDSNGAGKSAFVWGAQAEAGSFATSYIPTVASQVTRAADAASMTGTNFSTWFNQGQGSFIVNAARAAVQDSSGGGGYGRILGNDSANNSFLEYAPSGNLLVVSGVASYTFTVPSLSTAASVFNNMAVAYDSSGISVTANNAAVQVSSASARMKTSDRLNIFSTGTGGYLSSGWVKKIAYYPLKVTSTNMQALTS